MNNEMNTILKCSRWPTVSPLIYVSSPQNVSVRAEFPGSNNNSSRRQALAASLVAPLFLTGAGDALAGANLDSLTPMDSIKNKDYGKPRLRYSDFVETESGLQYKDLKEGSGPTPKPGQRVVVDWAGVTIGYYGRPFEARNKPKGSSFSDDKKEFLRFDLGKGLMIEGFEEAISSMKVGGIRRVVVQPELGYPLPDWKKKGPKPSTFAGERALGESTYMYERIGVRYVVWLGMILIVGTSSRFPTNH